MRNIIIDELIAVVVVASGCYIYIYLLYIYTRYIDIYIYLPSDNVQGVIHSE